MGLNLAEYLPIESRGELLLKGGLVTGSSIPYVGLIPYGLSRIGELTATSGLDQVGNGVGLTSLALLAPFFVSKAGVLFRTLDKPTIYQMKGIQMPTFDICGMTFSEEDLFTNVLITGTIGTGKTSTAIYPLLDQVFMKYCHEAESFEGDPFLKLGGLSLDVKGEFYEAVLWFGHAARRNIVEDIVVIRPSVYIPVVKFQDPETKRYFYLSALETSKGSEIKRLFTNETDAEGNPLPIDMFSWERDRLEPFEEHLRQKVLFDVSNRKLFFCGWRWDGDKLVRVARTPMYGKLEYMVDADGNNIVIDPPQTLRYCEVVSVDNGLRYNLVNPRLSAAENAKRLTDIGKLVDAKEGSGDNPYFEKASRRHIAMCIEGWRLVEKKQQISGPDIMRITSQAEECTRFKTQLKALKEKLEDDLSKSKKRGEKRELANRARKVKDIEAYFADTWETLEPKTKSITKSVVEQMFGDFLTDSELQESFCSPATFSFEQCIQEGKFFCFVVPSKYEGLAKVMGTTLKSDFQSTMLGRPSTARMNQSRVQLLVIDECHKYAVAGGSSGNGDENFQSLSRQSRVMNVHATQSDASLTSVIGKDKADVYLQSYGGRCWFQNSDPATNERAATMCGKVLKEIEDLQSGDFSMSVFLGAKEGGKVKRETKIAEKARFPVERFNNLDKWQSITYNKGHKGTVKKALLKQNIPHSYSSPDNKPKVGQLLRWYIQAYVENLAYKQDLQLKNDKTLPAEDKPVGWMFDPIVPGDNEDGLHVPAAAGTRVGDNGDIVTGQIAPKPKTTDAATAPNAETSSTNIPIGEVDEKNPPPPSAPKTTPADPSSTTHGDANEVPPLRTRKTINFPTPKFDDAGGPAKPETPTKPTPAGDRKVTPGQPQRADIHDSATTLPPSIDSAFKNGEITMAQLREVQKFFRDPATGIALATQMFESIKAERIYQPQEHYAEENANSRRKGLGGDPEQLAVGQDGKSGGNPEIATKNAPKLKFRDENGNENLNLSGGRTREILKQSDSLRDAAQTQSAKDKAASTEKDSVPDLDSAGNLFFT